MQTFFSDAYAAGSSTKRYASDLSSALTAGTLNSSFGGNIRSDFSRMPGAPLREFEVSPAVHKEGSNKFAPPLQSTEDVNPRITVQGRRIMPLSSARLGNADLGPPVERQLAHVWRTRPSEPNVKMQFNGNSNTSTPNFFNSILGAPQLKLQHPSYGMSVQAVPSLAAESTAMNFVLADLQREYAGVDNGAHYLKLTEEMLYYGSHDCENYYYDGLVKQMREKLQAFSLYEGFEWDGIPRNTIAEDGTAPRYDDGIVRGNARSQRAAKTYVVAMTARGDELCLDYWKGQSLEAGTLLYAILMKSPIDNYLHPETAPDGEDRNSWLLYHLATKAHDEYRDGASMQRMLQMPTIEFTDKDDIVQKVPMRPFQWHFVSSKTTLDRREHAQYKDEMGITRFGLVVFLATVLHPPPSGTITKPSRKSKAVVPYMDNRHAMRSEPLTVILNPDSGFRCAD